MTQDEIIEMALQAGMRQDGNMWFSLGKGDMDVENNHLEAFAQLVAAKERKACAELIAEIGSNKLANAIRARGEA